MKKILILFFVLCLLGSGCGKKSAGEAPSLPSSPSSTFGIIWKELPGNPSISPGDCPSWRCGGVSDPTLLLGSQGKVDVWLTTIGIQKNGSGFASNGPYIAKASGRITPANQFHFSQENPVVPVAPEGSWDRYVETPTVRKIGETLIMWYLGYAEPGFVAPALGQMAAANADGTAWVRSPQPIYRPSSSSWDNKLVTGPSVVQGPDKVWRLYYSGIGTKNGVGLLTSQDGLAWAPYSGNPVFENEPGGWDDQILEQAVVYARGMYWMWYSGWRGDLKPDTAVSIGLATSPDGIHWARYPSNPVIQPGAAGSWDDLRVLAPDVAVEPDGSLLMAAYGQSRKDIGKAAGYIGFWQSK